ncbi:hypothetical protein [Alkalispirochaeta alkalica]|uniref:hypothetical protein n=1 Tax=Alkalispirochaeta alkalica TaxID=46356 RepID=UPI000684B86A|nr:hypothetical protein [Alkalispirochaeta alkalica]
MARKLSEIERMIHSRVDDFRSYLDKNLPGRLLQIIRRIETESSIFIFSGVIRDFFLGREDIRDIDLVLEKPIDIDTYFADVPIRKNSFGGYKILYDDIPVDLWYIRDTWAYKFQKVFDFYPGVGVFQTAFFNFSNIIFSLSENKFYFSNHFTRFLRDKEIDIGYPINANYDLCIVNTIYYSQKLNLKVSDNLKLFILQHYKPSSSFIEDVQKKHFGSVLYDSDMIQSFMEDIRSELVSSKKLPNI